MRSLYSPIKQKSSNYTKSNYCASPYSKNDAQSCNDNPYQYKISCYDKENYNGWNNVQNELKNYGYRRKIAQKQGRARSPLSKRDKKLEKKQYQHQLREENFNKKQVLSYQDYMKYSDDKKYSPHSLKIYTNTHDPYSFEDKNYEPQRSPVKLTHNRNYSYLQQSEKLYVSSRCFQQQKQTDFTPKKLKRLNKMQSQYDKHYRYFNESKYQKENQCDLKIQIRKSFPKKKQYLDHSKNQQLQQDSLLSKSVMLKSRIQQLNNKTPRKSSDFLTTQNINQDLLPFNSNKHTKVQDDYFSVYQGQKYSFLQLSEEIQDSARSYNKKIQQRYSQKDNKYTNRQNNNWQLQKFSKQRKVLETLQQCNESEADPYQGLDKIAYLSQKINQRIQNILKEHDGTKNHNGNKQHNT